MLCVCGLFALNRDRQVVLVWNRVFVDCRRQWENSVVCLWIVVGQLQYCVVCLWIVIIKLHQCYTVCGV